MYGLPFEPEDAQAAHDDVLRIVIATNWRSLDLRGMYEYPQGWCSVMSYSVGRLLLRRGQGEWRIAANGAHDWLEYVDQGDIVYSIDATQHQFPAWDDPWLGWGPAPISRTSQHVDYATCGREPNGWVKKPEVVVHAEVLRQLG